MSVRHSNLLHRLAIAATVLILRESALAAPPAAEAVNLRTDDGLRLFGDFYPPKDAKSPAPFVILLHMYSSNRLAWEPLLEPLHDAGFAVLTLDLRGHGDSATTETAKRVEERDPKIFAEMQQDVRAAYDWIAARKEVDRARFALVGASVGCSIAIQYAAADRSVDTLVCLTPGMDYLGLDSAADIKQIQGRRMLLMATEDERVACDELARLNDGAKVRVLKGKAHGTHMFELQTGAVAETVEFLSKNIGPESRQPVYGSINKNIYHAPDSEWVKEISPSNLRIYSSAQEAESRGLRKARSTGPNDRRNAAQRGR